MTKRTKLKSILRIEEPSDNENSITAAAGLRSHRSIATHRSSNTGTINGESPPPSMQVLAMSKSIMKRKVIVAREPVPQAGAADTYGTAKTLE